MLDPIYWLSAQPKDKDAVKHSLTRKLCIVGAKLRLTFLNLKLQANIKTKHYTHLSKQDLWWYLQIAIIEPICVNIEQNHWLSAQFV